MSPDDAPENNYISALNAPLFYWPSMADTTKVLIFDYKKNSAGDNEANKRMPIS